MKRKVIRPWPVRLGDGDERDLGPGDIIDVRAVCGRDEEALVEFPADEKFGWLKRCSWFSLESVLWYSDRILAE